MKSYLFAVQDTTGREVCSTELDLDRVGDVAAVKVDDVVVHILRGDEVVAAGESGAASEGLRFLRWLAKDKLSTPVSKRVDTLQNRQ